MSKKKYYVVWVWKQPWIYENWDDCKEQVHWFVGAKYISFPSKEEAETAYKNEYSNFAGKKIVPTISEQDREKFGHPIKQSITVDGARNTATGKIEYQWVETDTWKLLFRKWPYDDGTNNIAEFLGLVHALAYCKTQNIDLPIYSDSRTAISWVKAKVRRTKQPKTEKNKELFELLDRATSWLQKNKYSNKILKWETTAWWENPADFGRK